MHVKIIKYYFIMILLYTTHLKAGIDDIFADYSKVYTVAIYDQKGIDFENCNEKK